MFVLFLIVFSAQFFAGETLAEYSPNKQYRDVVAKLRQLTKNYPQHASLITIGSSNAGVDIVGIRIGSGPTSNLVVGTHHGNEYSATEVAEAFAIDLARKPIVGQSIYVIPVLNIGGYNARSRRESILGRSVDPNRDYPGPCGTEGPFLLNSTKALADFLELTGIVNSVTLHASWPAILYPWGISTADLDTGYTNLFVQMGLAAAQFSGYKVANSTEELYPADGTFEDYAYWKHGIWSLLFELGQSQSPNQSAIDEMVRTNIPGLRKMFEMAPSERATEHNFSGICDGMSMWLDRHDE